MREIALEKDWVESWTGLDEKCREISEYFQLALDEGDTNYINSVKNELNEIEAAVASLELKSFFKTDEDKCNAILSINPGAGGTESQDWAEMLLRMYMRWVDRMGFEVEILDRLEGDVAGIKSVTLQVKGNYAYGYLKSESGVHRLVRLSPFDSNNRRHTSFASVFAFPEIEKEETTIEINPVDLRIDTYRSGGKGGQNVNKVETAVRITHLPTNTVAACQSERSQFQNRDRAMKLLISKLHLIEKQKEQDRLAEIEDSKSDITWGSQIRSYVFHPYNLVKDHRTSAETSNSSSVMDGDLDLFIEAYLKNQKVKR